MSFATKLMASMGFGSSHKGFCAFCREPRVVFRKKRVNLYNLMTCLLGTAIFCAMYWSAFDPRAILIFIFAMAISEIFLQIRWRMSVVCRHCGFDPVIYVKNTDRAAEMVKEQLLRRQNDPRFVLARPLNIPRISKERSETLQRLRQEAEKSPKMKRGQILSKQI